jgi:long-chain acyl-CoA synthetase
VIRTTPRPASLATIHHAWLGSGRTALTDLSGQRRERLDYDAFDELCARIAGRLTGLGIVAGDRVGLLGENSVRWIAAFFAILRLGAVAVPLSPRQPDAILAEIGSDAELRLVLQSETGAARLASRPAERLDGEGLLGAPVAPADVDPADTAILLYTSGSTGRPKGALLSHRSQLFTLESWAAVETSRTMTRTLVAAPLFHKNGLGETKLALWLGAEAVLQRRFDPRDYLQAAAAERCSTLSGVPTMFALMLAEPDLVDRLDLSGVRGLEIGSSPLSEALLDRVRRAFPRARIYNSYGTTEVAAVFGDHPDGRPAPRTTVGYPLPTVEVGLRGPDGHEANPGELWVRCEGVMDGYLSQPELTAAKLVDGWCRTGDVMLRDAEGWFHFVGRADDMFVVGGENVYPGAVVQLLERHRGVRQAAVVAVPDDAKGSLPVAFVVATPGAEPTEDALTAWCVEHGPGFARPRAVWFVDALPLGGTEKVDTQALARIAAERLGRVDLTPDPIGRSAAPAAPRPSPPR